MARPLPFYSLPLKARNLVYNYLDLTGCTVDLNYCGELSLYPPNEYPDESDLENPSCFHNSSCTIIRCKDYRTSEEYWEWSRDEFDVNFSPLSCRGHNCSRTGFVVDWLHNWYGSKADAPEPFRNVFEKNHLRICRGSPGGFAPFFKLPTDGLCELRTLTVRLDGEPQGTIKLGGDWTRLKQLAPLKLHSRYGNTAMKEWERLIRRLAECIRPSHLTLYLIVNVPDIKTAEAVLKPLDQLPTLKDCGIWLNQKPIPEFITLAQTTIKHLTTTSLDHKSIPFRYLDLPQELRFRILEYSDLISGEDLEWKPPFSSIGSILDSRCRCEIRRGRYRKGHLGNRTREYVEPAFKSYLNYWDTTCISAKHCLCELKGEMSLCYRTRTGFCECIFHCNHSSHTSSTVIKSDHGVHPLFLVSHQVRQDVIPVFFQRNRFLVSPPGVIPARFAGKWPYKLHLDHAILPMPRVELSLFLSSLPRNAFHHIRYLEWVLPQFGNYRTATRSAYLDYLDTIEMMAHAMHLPLT